jgi:arsenate reductase-like glutaredoxin family protein
MVDAKKQRYDAAGAIGVLGDAHTLLVAKGKNVTRVDLANDRPDDGSLASLLLGPSGNLRAPTYKAGGLMIVGFNPEMYEELISG